MGCLGSAARTGVESAGPTPRGAPVSHRVPGGVEQTASARRGSMASKLGDGMSRVTAGPRLAWLCH